MSLIQFLNNQTELALMLLKKFFVVLDYQTFLLGIYQFQKLNHLYESRNLYIELFCLFLNYYLIGYLRIQS